MSKIKSKDILGKEVLLFLPMRKVLQVITYSKKLHEVLKIRKEERSLLKRIYDTPMAPLHYSCRFSKQSTHINGFLYNKLDDYKKLIHEQATGIDEKTFDDNFLAYLKSLKSDFLCMLDLNDPKGLELARQLKHLKFGLFLDYATNTKSTDLSGINLTFFSDNLEKLESSVRDYMLDQLANCPLEKMRLTFPNELKVEKFQKLPKLKKIQIANNWKSGDELIRALNAIQHMGDSIESLTIYTIQKCVEGNQIQQLKEALSNFKKVKSLYIRQSVNEVMSYDKFADIFSSFAGTLEKLKFDLDIFESKVPITFKEFKNLKKVIIKNTKAKQSVYDLKHIPKVEIQYNKVPIHRTQMEALKEPVQGYHVVIDKEGYTDEEEKQILNVVNKNKIVKFLSLRGINHTSVQIIDKLASDNLEDLELMTLQGDWKLEDVLTRNKAIRNVRLIDLGNPVNNNSGLPQTNVVFPDSAVNLFSLFIKKSILKNMPNLFKGCQNLKKLAFDNLTLTYEDFKYFCEHIQELKCLESINFGEIKIVDKELNQEVYDYYNKFFEGISKINTLTSLDFQSNFRLNLEFLSIIGKNLGYIKNLEYLKLSVLEPKDSFEARKILLQAAEKLHHLKTLKLIMFES